MSFETLLSIMMTVVITGTMIGYFSRRVVSWLVHLYRLLFFKPQLLELYQVSQSEKKDGG
jgi:hypothetical protein